jgi:ferric-dicitrate binding protein FerR (iron transport regulator)
MSKVKQIIEQYFERQHPEEIRQSFFFWMRSPVSAKTKEDVLYQLWNELDIPSNLSTEKSYKELEKRLHFTRQTSKRVLYAKLTRIAAIFLIPLLSILSVWFYINNRQPQQIDLIECYVPNGEIREIELPDQSRVVINSGSCLFYQKEFKGKTREIYLSGEAKFIVSPDKNKPFIVKTNDLFIEALGTVFNVSSFPDNPHTTATLIEGLISVDIRSTDEHFMLDPGKQVLYDKTTGYSTYQQARLDYVLAWEKGQLVFQSASLNAIIKELERRYNVSFYLNDTGLEEERLTVKFMHDETLNEILHTLQQIITGFDFNMKGDKIYIY